MQRRGIRAAVVVTVGGGEGEGTGYFERRTRCECGPGERGGGEDSFGAQCASCERCPRCKQSANAAILMRYKPEAACADVTIPIHHASNQFELEESERSIILGLAGRVRHIYAWWIVLD